MLLNYKLTEIRDGLKIGHPCSERKSCLKRSLTFGEGVAAHCGNRFWTLTLLGLGFPIPGSITPQFIGMNDFWDIVFTEELGQGWLWPRRYRVAVEAEDTAWSRARPGVNVAELPAGLNNLPAMLTTTLGRGLESMLDSTSRSAVVWRPCSTCMNEQAGVHASPCEPDWRLTLPVLRTGPPLLA